MLLLFFAALAPGLLCNVLLFFPHRMCKIV